jgi:hypothetical protein
MRVTARATRRIQYDITTSVGTPLAYVSCARFSSATSSSTHNSSSAPPSSSTATLVNSSRPRVAGAVRIAHFTDIHYQTAPKWHQMFGYQPSYHVLTSFPSVLLLNTSR